MMKTSSLLDEVIPICIRCGADLKERCLNFLNGEGPLCTDCANGVKAEQPVKPEQSSK